MVAGRLMNVKGIVMPNICGDGSTTLLMVAPLGPKRTVMLEGAWNKKPASEFALEVEST